MKMGKKLKVKELKVIVVYVVKDIAGEERRQSETNATITAGG